MGKLNKFENVDVTASLEAIMKQNTAFYQSDFDIDKEIIKRAAESPNAGDKMLLWFSRPSGTCCIKERDAFLKDTREHNTWKFYGEQTRDRVLAYAVELTGIQDGKITGNLYELDYQQHYKHVTEQALPADNYMLIYEHGEREQPAARPFDASIYLLGYLAVYLFLYFTAVLRSFGNAMFQMISMLVSTILNAVLDPIFIHFFGFHGAAIATLISQSICLVFMICYLKKKRLFNMRLNLFDKAFILPLIQKAVPAIVQQSIPAISTTFLTALISSYSITAIAAYGITGKLETILFYPAMALNMVLTTIIGQCVGGKRTDRVKDYLKCALKYGSLFLFLLSAIIVSSSKYLSMLFVRSSDVASIVSGYFLIVGIGYILNTITNCFLGMLNGLGQPSKSMLLMIFYYIIVRMPLAYLFSYLGLGLNGIWIAVLISHICAAIAAMLFSMLQLKRKTTIS